MTDLTLDALLARRAAEAPEHPLYTYLDAQGEAVSTLATGALFARSRAVATALRDAGAERRPVLVCVGPGIEHPPTLFGAFLAGATVVPVYPPLGNPAAVEAIAGVVRSAGTRLLLAPEAVGSELIAALAPLLGDRAPRLLTLEAALETPPAGDLPGSRPDDAAIVLYTSGSTGTPKGAMLTHDAFIDNMRAMEAECGRSAEDVICSWLPHAHIAGLYTRLLALWLGARAVVFPAPAFAARPTLWLEVMSRHRCTVTAAPDFAYALSAQLFTDEQAAGLDLSRWAMAVSGGEVVRPATLERFASRFAASGFRPEAFHPYYGLTETLCTSIPQGSRAGRLEVSRRALLHGRLAAPAEAADALTLVGNGQPLGERTRVLAVDPETLEPSAPGRVGEIWTCGPAVTKAYHGDPARSEEACRARLADGSGAWFRTGDLGLVHEGQLYVTGRLKELIIVRGKNHYPGDIEATVAQAAAGLGLREATAFALTLANDEESLALAVELEAPEAVGVEFLRRVRRAVATRHGLMIQRLYLLKPGSLPRTLTNKVSRARCRQAADAGTWDASLYAVVRQETEPQAPSPAAEALKALEGPALRQALEARLLELVAQSEGGAPSAAELDRPIPELGLSSIDVARIAAGLRTATGAEPPFAAFFDGSSWQDLAEALARKLEGEAPTAMPADGWRTTMRRVASELPDRALPRRTREGRIFLTGATGFLGSWLLAELLQRGDRQIECLVRAADAEAGLARLVKALEGGPGWREAWRERLAALPGDAALPRFGLDAGAWEALGERTALVVHNAANVNFVAPYAALKPVNVDPVHAVLALSLMGGEARPVHFVSTTAVFNSAYRREQRRILASDRLTEPDHLYSGYAQTKWVAESAFRAGSIGGVPLGVHRPGLIIGASTTGQAHADDFLCRLILGCIELGRYPDVDVELDLVPVDDVAAGIAAAVLAPLPHTLNVCQWTAPRPVTVSALFEAFRRRGHRVEPEPLQAWLRRVRTELPADNALFPVHPFLFEVPPGGQETLLELLDGLPLDVDPGDADAVRTAAGLAPSVVDAALLDRMAAWLESAGCLPVPV